MDLNLDGHSETNLLNKAIGGFDALKKLLESSTSSKLSQEFYSQFDTKKEIVQLEQMIKSMKTEVEKQNQLTLKSSLSRSEKVSVYYSSYLSLDKILNAQNLESEKVGKPAHDEMLFIIIHQAYELWFKQILWELNAAITILNKDYVPEKEIAQVVFHLSRIATIQEVLIQQLKILETMTPLNFMDFRDFLFPASGFQSFQFRLIENRIGQLSERRVQYENKAYHTKLSEEHQKLVQESEKMPSLFQVVEKWLERAPTKLEIENESFDFLSKYRLAVEKMFSDDKETVRRNFQEMGKGNDQNEELKGELERIDKNLQSFKGFWDQETHDNLVKSGNKRLSLKATQAALLIFVYQDEPIFHLPFRLLQCLIDLDENMSSWRQKHMMMVHRMIGTKIGTGGSSGYWYLKSTIEKGRIFSEIGNLCTYLIPRKDLPSIPPQVQKQFGFAFENLKK